LHQLGPFAEKVKVYGILPSHKVNDLYQKSSLFLETSIFHGFGRTVAEAMACGCIPVTTASGGPREFCRNNYNSILFDHRDPEIIASEIVTLLSDESRLLSLSKNCIETISDRFDIKRAASSLLSTFKYQAH
jgi:glycosyltransferase involved in cell wall biosynthesis